MIRRIAVVAGLVALPAAIGAAFVGRGTSRLLAGPRRLPDEAALRPALDAFGGEVVRLRSRDGLRLSGRWLSPERVAGDDWTGDPHEAIVLLHGYSGSVAPDVVEYGPFLRRTAGVLGLDFGGHGDSDDAPTTFGLREVEDVAGALAWLGERGIERVALFGTSMGGITAIASLVVLGDGTLAGVDADPDAPAGVAPPRRPRIVGVVADSVPPELPTPVANRMHVPFSQFVARRMFERASRRLGADMRATEPIRVIGLVETVPLLLVHGEADDTIPIADGRRLAMAGGPTVEHWVVPGAGHSRAHATDPEAYEGTITPFVRRAFLGARGGQYMIGAPDDRTAGPGADQEGN